LHPFVQALKSLFSFLLPLSAIAGALLLYRSEAQFWLEARHFDSTQEIVLPSPNDQFSEKRWAKAGKNLLYVDPGAAANTLIVALSTDPANAELWSHLSIARFYSNEPQLGGFAGRRALQLAPNQLNIALDQALLAADFWQLADRQTLAMWTQNLEVLADHAPLALKRWSVEVDRDQKLCAIVAAIEAFNDFCESTTERRKHCAGLIPKTRQERRKIKLCKRDGYPTSEAVGR